MISSYRVTLVFAVAILVFPMLPGRNYAQLAK